MTKKKIMYALPGILGTIIMLYNTSIGKFDQPRTPSLLIKLELIENELHRYRGAGLTIEQIIRTQKKDLVDGFYIDIKDIEFYKMYGRILQAKKDSLESLGEYKQQKLWDESIKNKPKTTPFLTNLVGLGGIITSIYSFFKVRKQIKINKFCD